MGCHVKNDWCEVGKKFDTDMYLFIEKRLSWGISYIAKKYSEVNNEYLKDYDPTKPSEFISYLDMNKFMVGQWMIIFVIVD